MSAFKTTKLSNGIVVATEEVKGIRSASIGIWLDIGSRDETPENNGLSHFFEHMAFKGTATRTGLDIVQSLEASGGQVNAFTTKEQTCFYARVIDKEASAAIEILLDMVLFPNLTREDIKKERDVIIEELKGVEDNPDERVYDLFSRALYGSQSVGFPIAGTLGSVRRLKQEHMKGHLHRIHNKLPVFVVASGKVKHEDVVGIARRISKSAIKDRLKPQSRSVRVAARRRLKRQKVSTFHNHLTEHKDIYEANAILGGPGYAIDDKRRYSLLLLNCILGDGMSSRLFQSLREQYGYVYNVNSFIEGLVGTGIIGISFSTDPKYLKDTFRIVREELLNLCNKGITPDELVFAKENIKGTVLLDMENTQSRMALLARLVMYGGAIKSLDKYLNVIDKITKAEVDAVITRTMQPSKWASAMVLPKGVRFRAGNYLS